MNQKGGYIITITGDSEELFKEFLAQCKLTFLSTGAQGLVFKAEHSPNISSPYKEVLLSSDNKTILQITDVKVIILKLLIVTIDPDDPNDPDDPDDPDDGPITFEMGKTMFTISDKEFEDEVKSQSHMYSATNVLFESIVPYVFFTKTEEGVRGNVDSNPDSGLRSNKESENATDSILQLLRTLKNNSKLTAPYLQDFLSLIQKNSEFFKLGIIAMEIANRRGSNIKGLNYNNSYEFSVAIETLIRFTLMTGIIHGDHHSGNILINSGIEGYYDPNNESVKWSRNMRCVIIDFGRSHKLSEPDWERFKSLFDYFINDNDYSDTHSLTNLMTWIFNQGCMLYGDITPFDKLESENETVVDGMLKKVKITYGIRNIFYGWIVKKITPDTKNFVKKLFLSRKRQIDSIRKSWPNNSVDDLISQSQITGINDSELNILKSTKVKDPIDEFLLPNSEEIKKIYDGNKLSYHSKYIEFRDELLKYIASTMERGGSKLRQLFEEMSAILNKFFGQENNNGDIVCRAIYWYFTNEFEKSKTNLINRDDDDDDEKININTTDIIEESWYILLASSEIDYPINKIIEAISDPLQHGGFVKKSKNKRKPYSKRIHPAKLIQRLSGESKNTYARSNKTHHKKRKPHNKRKFTRKV
jgi:hypothetical protein